MTYAKPKERPDWEALMLKKFGPPRSAVEDMAVELDEMYAAYCRQRNWLMTEADDGPDVRAFSARLVCRLGEYEAACQAQSSARQMAMELA